MEETIISINGPNLMSMAIMIVILLLIAYGFMLAMAKMRAGRDA